MRKNADGAVVSIDSNPAEKSPRVYLESMSVVSGNAVYFTVNPVSEDGSEIGFDGEYGLYRIPYGIIEYEDKYSSGNRYSDVRINEISMVYPLNEGTDVVNISTSPDESELYLTLRKESEISLVVFDCATMSVKQNSPIFTCNSSSPVQMVDIEKDYLLYKVDFRTFALIDNHTGEWKTKFTVTDESINTYWSSYEFINHYAYDTVTAYDGERLAILGHASRFNTSNDKSSFTAFYLSIYSEKGNLYTGEFSSTLDTGTHLRYNYIAKPVDGTTPSLVLPEK